MLRRILVLQLLLTTACATYWVRARHIQVVDKADVARCDFVGVVYGHGLNRLADLLESAEASGATHVVVLHAKGTKMTADAFDCRPPPEGEQLARGE